jgi:predicted amidohydrolase
VHLFDVAIEGQAPIGESRRFAPGDAAVVLDTPWGPWGLSICYDLRFPYFYRRYGQEGVSLIFIPSAFTVPTGRAHWEVLIRARAIETGAFVLAAAQSGTHADGRETWGHALAVDPWGAVLADLDTRGARACGDRPRPLPRRGGKAADPRPADRARRAAPAGLTRPRAPPIPFIFP